MAFAIGIFCCITLNVKSKKQAKNQNKSIREMAKTLGLAESAIWYIIKYALASSGVPKGLENHRKQLWWMTMELVSLYVSVCDC